MRRLLLAAFAALLLPAAARAQGFMQVTDPAQQGMTIKYHRVAVAVDNQIATTEVDQVFVNPNPGVGEATYLFPVPENASMSKLSMWIDGREQEAELLDSERARGIYEEIVRRRQDPALLEFMGKRVYRLRVFPIAPREEKRVKLTYSETIAADSGVCVYRYGLDTGRFSRTAVEETRVAVTLKSNVPIKSVYSPSHAVDVARPGEFEATAVYEVSRTVQDRDFVLYFTQAAGEFGMNMVAHRTPGEDGYFMLLLAPRAEAADGELVRRDVCFVVDTSMSMADQDRIVQARKALKAGLQTLNPGDRFNVVNFSTDVYPWAERLQEVNDGSLAAAGLYVDRLKARGGTNISGALEAALAMAPGDPARPYMVIFMTDGEPTLGETDPERIAALARAANKTRARIFTLGVGFDLNVRLLDLLAEEHGGLREYVTPSEPLETRMAGYYEKLSSPVLADVTLEFAGGGVEIYDTFPRELRDIFKGQQIVVFGRYRKDGARAIRLRGTVNGKPREFTWEAAFPAQSAAHEAVPRLWAVAKIGHLTDAIRLNGEHEELRGEIIALAKEFGVVTRYTSFLVLEDEARATAAAGGRRNLRAGGGNGDPAMAFPDAEESDHSESADGEDAGKLKGDSGEALGALPGEHGRSAPTKGAGRYEALGAGGGAAGVRASREAEGMKSGREGAGNSRVQRVGSRTFYLTDGVWVDAAFKEGMKTTTVTAMSEEYFKLTKERPELARCFAVGEQVVVVVGEEAWRVVAAEKGK